LDNLSIVDTLLLNPLVEKYDGRKRDGLLPMLHEAQAIYGWLPGEIQQIIGETLRVPLADIHGVVEFYTMFYNEPTAKRVIRVCEDPACYLANGAGVMAAIEAKLGLHSGQTRPRSPRLHSQGPARGREWSTSVFRRL
jgi:NADH-quinone oxidoreductase subunit F